MKSSSLGTQLRHILDLLDGAVQSAYQDAGLSYRPRYTPVLRQLLQHEPLTVGQIAAGARITQPAATQTIELMIKDRLVRVTSGREDGRKRLISLTDRGRKIVPEVQRCWQATAIAHQDLEGELGFSLSDVLDRVLSALDRKSYAQRIGEARAQLQDNASRNGRSTQKEVK